MGDWRLPPYSLDGRIPAVYEPPEDPLARAKRLVLELRFDVAQLRLKVERPTIVE